MASDDCLSLRPSIVESLYELIGSNVRYPTIYRDPPWRYDNAASRAAAENHYATMPFDDIKRLPVSELAAKNEHLHLWATTSFLREALTLIDAWGLGYKSCLVWIKDQIGMGNYWSISHEYLLLGVRGSLRFGDRSRPSWVGARRNGHSRKPGVFAIWSSR
jgi:N6-adenosine-specific RNA methylase IME4